MERVFVLSNAIGPFPRNLGLRSSQYVSGRWGREDLRVRRTTVFTALETVDGNFTKQEVVVRSG